MSWQATSAFTRTGSVNGSRRYCKKGSQVLATSNAESGHVTGAKEAELYEQIGRLKMELEWLKNCYPKHLS